VIARGPGSMSRQAALRRVALSCKRRGTCAVLLVCTALAGCNGPSAERWLEARLSGLPVADDIHALGAEAVAGLGAALQEESFFRWERAFGLFRDLTRRSDYLLMYEHWARAGHLDQEKLKQLEQFREQWSDTEILDDMLLVDQEFCRQVARKYVFFSWARQRGATFSSFLTGLAARMSPAERHLRWTAFLEAADRAGADIDDSGIWRVADPMMLGLDTSGEAGAKHVSVMHKDLRAWWSGPGVAVERKGLHYLLYLEDALGPGWDADGENAVEIRKRAEEVALSYPKAPRETAKYLHTSSSVLQEAALRHLALSLKRGTRRLDVPGEWLTKVRQLAHAPDPRVAAQAKRVLRAAKVLPVDSRDSARAKE